MLSLDKILGTATAALVLAVVPALSAVAAPAAGTADTRLAGCITWLDSAGPAGAGRGHAKCAGMGVYVRATVHCADGSSATSGWRWEYNKAECPTAVKARSVSYQTKK
ncbi:hypothetical protein [Saccharothrix sp. ST-888]|uniref:hypothetical protein n=1 Tax=Saccharothrix sp. ST-888 TaxID=1427391 RepID=UPI0005EC3F63|nr:hypothetical protein [Saccharothrix sp. ST-888]KJK59414.1 hypothetical protein UK12_04180 [Saccharothrix sp. ST-888]